MNEHAVLVPNPPICERAVKERKAEQLAIVLTYDSSEMVVELVSKANLDDPPGINLQPAACF